VVVLIAATFDLGSNVRISRPNCEL
jgi:hypothetical protein